MSILQIFMCVRNIVDALDDRNDFSEADLGLMKMSILQIFMCVWNIADNNDFSEADMDVIKMSILQIFICVWNIVDALDDNNDFSEADPDLIIGTGLVVITHNRTERFHVYFINCNFCQHCQLYKSTLQFP